MVQENYKYIVMMNKEYSIKIENFMTSRVGVLMLGHCRRASPNKSCSENALFL